MTYIPVLFGIMVTVFVTYVGWIWARYGVLKSISESYYQLPKNLQPLFTLFCWGFAFPAMILGVPSGPLMFLATGGIMFVGAAAAFKDLIMTHDVHMVCAGIGVVCSQLAIGLYYGLWPMNVAFVLISLLLLLFRNKINNKHIWWIEITAFISICIALGITLL